MKKTILRSSIGVFCLVISAGCGKDVKAPSNTTVTAAKTTSASPAVTQNTNQAEGGYNCGSSSGSSSSGNSTGGY